MKKLFFILVLCLCGSLFAEEFKVGDSFFYSAEQSEATGDFHVAKITAVLPYENGYILKLVTNNNTLEYYITKGFVFYAYNNEFDDDYNWYLVFRKHTITKTSPNTFETEAVEYERR